MSIFLSLTSLLKFELSCSKDEQTELNKALKQKLAPINYHLGRSNNPEDIKVLGNQANIIIRDFLLENPEAFEQIEATKKSKYKRHTSKTLEEAIKIKKELRNKVQGPNATIEDRKKFREALKAISDLRKIEKKMNNLKLPDTKKNYFSKISGILPGKLVKEI